MIILIGQNKMWRIPKRCVGAVLLIAFVTIWAPAAHSDTISIYGVQHTDVLVSVSPTTYYIRFPDTGTILSVPKDSIDSSTLTINKDPYYRDALNERFKASKNRMAGGDDDDAGSADGLGTSRAAIEELLVGTGIVFGEARGEGADTVVNGATPDGLAMVALAGRASNLTHISFKYSVAQDDAAMQQGTILQIQRLSRSIADWILPWVEKNGVHLVQDGRIENAEDGVIASVTRSIEGALISFEFAARPDGTEALSDLQLGSFEGEQADRRAEAESAQLGEGLGGRRGGEAPHQVAQLPPPSSTGTRARDSDASGDFGSSRLRGSQGSSTSSTMTDAEAEELVAAMGGLLFVLLGIALLYYIHFAITLQIMANKTETEFGWLAWIPIFQMLLMVRIPEKPWWWFVLMFVPVVGLIMWILTWIGIAEAREKPGWMGVLTIFPFTSFVTRTYLAFSE